MSFHLSQEFTFDAAHTLVRHVPLSEFTPSTRIHGHSYTATVTIKGDKGRSGMVEKFSLGKNKSQVIDLFYLREAIVVVKAQLDHQFLDEVEGLAAGTLECLCEFIFTGIKPSLSVESVTVRRVSSGDSCTYKP